MLCPLSPGGDNHPAGCLSPRRRRKRRPLPPFGHPLPRSGRGKYTPRCQARQPPPEAKKNSSPASRHGWFPLASCPVFADNRHLPKDIYGRNRAPEEEEVDKDYPQGAVVVGRGIYSLGGVDGDILHWHQAFIRDVYASTSTSGGRAEGKVREGPWTNAV